MTTKVSKRRTTAVPVTTMEEVPLLSSREREELLGLLEDAEGEIRAGKGVEYDPKIFKKRLTEIFRARKR